MCVLGYCQTVCQSESLALIVEYLAMPPGRHHSQGQVQVQSNQGDYPDDILEPSASLAKHCDILDALVVCRIEQGTLPVCVISDPLKSVMKVGTLFTKLKDEVEQCDEGDGEDTMQPWTVDTLIKVVWAGREGLFLRLTEASQTTAASDPTGVQSG